MNSALADRRETTDGRRPDARHLPAETAEKFPLVAFALLEHGDVFDGERGRPANGASIAARAIDESVRWSSSDPVAERVRADLIAQLEGNARLAGRMANAKPLRVDLVASRNEMVAFGYPRSIARHAAGLFWDDPSWPRARIALRRDRLAVPEERTLVFHEYAHAIHYLGFTAEERRLVQRVLQPVFGHPADQDEVFAIYSEREFLDRRAFSALEREAPGVYGVCRRQWSEDHLFAAFIKKLYRPGQRIRAGDRDRDAALKWRRFLGR